MFLEILRRWRLDVLVSETGRSYKSSLIWVCWSSQIPRPHIDLPQNIIVKFFHNDQPLDSYARGGRNGESGESLIFPRTRLGI